MQYRPFYLSCFEYLIADPYRHTSLRLFIYRLLFVSTRMILNKCIEDTKVEVYKKNCNAQMIMI